MKHTKLAVGMVAAGSVALVSICLSRQTGGTVAAAGARSGTLAASAPFLKETRAKATCPSAAAVKPPSASEGPPDDLPGPHRPAQVEAVREASYDVYDHSGHVARGDEGAETLLVAENPSQRYRTTFDADEVVVALQEGARGSSPPWRAGFKLTGFGPADAVRTVGEGQRVAHGVRVEYRRRALVEWYENTAQGLEQGFTVSTPPQGTRQGGAARSLLRIDMELTGNLTPRLSEDATHIQMRNPAGACVFTYGRLAAWDSAGRALRSHMAVDGTTISLTVDATRAVYPVTIDPYVETKLLPADLAAGDYFGYAVAADGNTLVVSSPGDDEVVADSGSVYVYTRSGAAWTLQAKLTAGDPGPVDRLGWSVAISGDTVVAGAKDDDVAGVDSGSAYVFRRSGTTWSQEDKLTASDGVADDCFGWSVGIDGETIVVGASGVFDSTTSPGSAYVFTRSGTIWSEQAKLVASDPATGDNFGRSVAISGDTAVVGATLDDVEGSVTVFLRSGTVWGEQAKLPSPEGAWSTRFGTSVAIEGDTMIVGASMGDVLGHPAAGIAYVFARSGTVWPLQAKLVAPVPAGWNYFGGAVAISGSTAVISAPGTYDAVAMAHVFTRSGPIWTWEDALTASDGTSDDGFGSVFVSDGTVLVGAKLSDAAGNDSGALYIYSPPNQAPSALGDGYSVAVDGSLGVTDAEGVLANDFDPEYSPLVAQLVAGPAFAASFALNADGSFTYTPQASWYGMDSFTYTAYDGDLVSGVATVIIVVSRTPVAVDDSYNAIMDGTRVVSAADGVLMNDHDDDGDPLAVVLDTGPANAAAFTLNADGSFTYTPVAAWSGTDTFTYMANDGTSDSNVVTVSIVVSQPARIGDLVWVDDSRDGIQDFGELGLAGVTVELCRDDDVPVGTTTTASDGSYEFTDVIPGSYYVQFQIPSGYKCAPQDTGGNDGLDSDAGPVDGKTGVFSVTAGANDTSWDAGLQTVPVVTATSPLDNATNVPTNTTVEVTFSEAMDQLSVEAPGVFTVSGGVAGDFTWAGNTVTFTPSENLSYLTSYTVTISTGVQNADGVSMEAEYSFSFTTTFGPGSGDGDGCAPSAACRGSAAAGSFLACLLLVSVALSRPRRAGKYTSQRSTGDAR